jgi:hypothetical protein
MPLSGADPWAPPIHFLVNHRNPEVEGHAEALPPLQRGDHAPGGLVAQAGQRDDQGQDQADVLLLVPKYPIGTFVIYSCLGSAKFTARPV